MSVSTITITNNSINSNNNNNNNNSNNIIIKKLNILSKEESLFFKVFHNLVILKEIYRNVRILEENDTCRFGSLREFYNHPNREYISNIVFDNSFNEKIPKNLLQSSTIKSISFGGQFNHSIKQSRLSNQIRELKFGYSFDKLLKKNMIPSTVTSLSFDHMFNQELIPNQSLPIGLKKITLGFSFNKSLQQNSLPFTITSLELGHSFNKPLSSELLPKYLKSLTLGACWDYPLNDTFSSSPSITNLKFYAFNHPIHCDKTKKSLLPPNLRVLQFVSKFDQPMVIGSLPSSLESLDLGFHYSQIIERGVLNANLKHLNLGNSYYWPIDKLGLVPNQLQTIKFPSCSFQKIIPHAFPRTLHTVSVGYYFKDLDQIPHWIKVLECSKTMLGIPKTINTIRFRDLDFSLNSISLVPDHINTIETGDMFNHPIKSTQIPPSITSFTFGTSFDQPIFESTLSNSNIKHLQFKCSSYSHPLTLKLLPSHLESLTISKRYKYFNSLPKSIKIILID